jgi:hypothetical protein
MESAHMDQVIPSGSEADKDTGENQTFTVTEKKPNDTAGEKAPNNTRCWSCQEQLLPEAMLLRRQWRCSWSWDDTGEGGSSRKKVMHLPETRRVSLIHGQLLRRITSMHVTRVATENNEVDGSRLRQMIRRSCDESCINKDAAWHR